MIDAQVLPFITPLTYLLVLPRPSAFTSVSFSPLNDGDSDGDLPVPYTSLPTTDEDTIEQEQERFTHSKADTVLSLADKWRLAKPLLLRYMLPLCEWFWKISYAIRG